ncbi:MAG: rod shape-determining protein MreC [Thermodesulfobacteriota bacterium]
MPERNRLLVLMTLLVLVMVTVSLHSDPRREPSLPQRALLEIVGTLQSGLTFSAETLEDLWLSYFYLSGLQRENQELKRALDRYRQQVNALKEKGLANQRLLRLLRFSSERNLNTLGARVVGWGPGPWFKTITIDRGRTDGLTIGLPVANDQGLVGRIVEVSPRYAKVLLLTDYNSSIDVLVQRNRIRGILAGRSEDTCSLRYVRTNENIVRGDLIVTSGQEGSIPRGLPLGAVSRVKKMGNDMFQEIDVTPAVDFDRLEEVLVILTAPPPF